VINQSPPLSPSSPLQSKRSGKVLSSQQATSLPGKNAMIAERPSMSSAAKPIIAHMIESDMPDTLFCVVKE
jgi:hypothetical protein